MRPRMRGVIHLGQMLKIQPSINLRGADVGVAEQLLHRAQIAAALQQVAGERMAQHVRVHRHRQPGLLAALAQLLPDGLRRQPRAIAPNQQGGRMGRLGKGGAQGQPLPRFFNSHAAKRHTAALAALAQHMGLGIVQVQPTFGLGAGLGVQPHQFAHAQAAAVEQLHHQLVAHLSPSGIVCLVAPLGAGSCCRVLKIGQLHGRIHRQGFGQRLGGFGRTHTVQRVVLQLTALHQPMVKAAPARKDERNAARTAPLAVHAGNPATQMGGLHLPQRNALLLRQHLQPLQISRIERHRARRQPLLVLHMRQIGLHPSGIRHGHTWNFLGWLG